MRYTLIDCCIRMCDFIFAYYIKWSSDFKFSIFLSRSSIFANRRSVSAEIDALDEISTSKTDINFANPDLKFVSCILFNFNTWIDVTVIYLTDSHVCLASSTAFEKIELFFRQQGWIQTDGWIEKLKKNQKNIKIWQTLYSKLIGDSKLIEVIESNESDKFSLVSLSSSKAADDRAILLLLTDSLSKMLEWSENELKLNFLWNMGLNNYSTWTRNQNILHLLV